MQAPRRLLTAAEDLGQGLQDAVPNFRRRRPKLDQVKAREGIVMEANGRAGETILSVL